MSVDLKTEAVLNADIRFSSLPSGVCENPNAIFLTGATGFLGAYLLDGLIKTTTGKIYCLVRCADPEEGRRRLRENLQFYALWNDALNARIVPVVGNLSKPLLGLLEEEFDHLASCIDVIYHCGAQINATRPYSALKAANVLGTREILRLAGKNRTKPLHFISTLAVFFSPAHSDANIEEADNPDGDGLKVGYRQTKWVAEQLVMAARERGLPANIYRVGRVWGHARTGITGNTDDLLYRLIKACLLMKKFPASNVMINIAPVDYISQAIIHLSQQQKPPGETFHLLNPVPLPLGRFFQEIRDLGYPLEETDREKWLAEVRRRVPQGEEKALYASLLLAIRVSGFFSDGKPRFTASRTTHDRLFGARIACPPVDRKLLAVYLSYFQQSGYIPVP
uniref:Thioester reductase domain-containing protein n=1 Tax=Candidatus Kentrum sp. FW TaxID=2126338 RepID=A0A450S7W3_9GAMM|nr:MAG: thioester reductase domain-containing protein [Candidatus Kentron sp. FW]